MAGKFKTRTSSSTQVIRSESNKFHAQFGSELPVEFTLQTESNDHSDMKLYRELYSIEKKLNSEDSSSGKGTDDTIKARNKKVDDLFNESTSQLEKLDEELATFMNKMAAALEKAMKAKILEHVEKRSKTIEAILKDAEKKLS